MRSLSLALVLLSVSPTLAGAQAAPSRERVRQMLSGIEHTPSDADWRRLGDGALPVLIELYQDTREPPYVRLRAVGATGAFPRAAVRTFLLAVARAPGQNDLLVREAVVTLARAFGPAAIDDLAPFLAHDEVVVRDGAVRALGRIGTPAARAALRARQPHEPDGVVRERIDAALR
ncbi:MAG: HEAT repeat domain-containing protein [Sandaracinaceae bacterium]|nr:HEAT repeat domain-containing protein [Sandaracinaceae bacterium]